MRTLNWNIIYCRLNEMYDARQEPSPRTKYSAMLEEIEDSSKWKLFRMWLISDAVVETTVADLFIVLLCPADDVFERAIWRSECSENMQRLALAILLYQLENGNMPDENWAEQIEKYLGENAEQYFSCPSNPLPKGETTYALVQYSDTGGAAAGLQDTILLVELKESVPLDKAVVTVDEVLERKRTGSLHVGGMNVAYRSGAVRFLSESASDEELFRLLGGKVEAVPDLLFP